tara:strand:- start:550 stop:837 length:288 start_codon:yes stop_codon:yes gene_type:complete
MPINFTVGINDNKKQYRKDLKPRGNVGRPGSTDKITSASARRPSPDRLPADPSKDYLGDKVSRQLVKHMTATAASRNPQLDPTYIPKLMKKKKKK